MGAEQSVVESVEKRVQSIEFKSERLNTANADVIFEAVTLPHMASNALCRPPILPQAEFVSFETELALLLAARFLDDTGLLRCRVELQSGVRLDSTHVTHMSVDGGPREMLHGQPFRVRDVPVLKQMRAPTGKKVEFYDRERLVVVVVVVIS